jgi:hypothetical protein
MCLFDWINLFGLKLFKMQDFISSNHFYGNLSFVDKIFIFHLNYRRLLFIIQMIGHIIVILINYDFDQNLVNLINLQDYHNFHQIIPIIIIIIVRLRNIHLLKKLYLVCWILNHALKIKII